jgi:hypothetical protein
MKQNRKTNRVRREYYQSTEKRCLGRGSHLDALALVEYLMQQPHAETSQSAPEIARMLGWEKRLGMNRVTDLKRFHIARNHVKDGRDQGKPCTGYSLHYRTSSAGNVWKLIDPSGSLQDHIYAAASEIRGDLQQQITFRTINGRRIATAEQMADWCLKATPQDGVGHRLMIEYSMELKKFGTVTDSLLAEINLWLAGVAV